MAERKPEILGRAEYDQHHGIRVSVIFRGLKASPIEKMSLGSTVQAMELAEVDHSLGTSGPPSIRRTSDVPLLLRTYRRMA